MYVSLTLSNAFDSYQFGLTLLKTEESLMNMKFVVRRFHNEGILQNISTKKNKESRQREMLLNGVP